MRKPIVDGSASIFVEIRAFLPPLRSRVAKSIMSRKKDAHMEKKFRFLLIQAFHLPTTSAYLHRPVEGPKEKRLMNHENLAPLLEDVAWELHPGPLAPYGDWPVESREEFSLVAAGRLPIVREACESRRFNAIILLGAGSRVSANRGKLPGSTAFQ